MVLVNYSGKEINAKVVYYGPGLCGKTTNLEAIYGRVPDGNRGKMVSMKTRTERTLFFDFLPLNLGDLAGFQTRFLLYTVPGQVYYNATRKLVLKGVDALVFVADSQRGKMDENIESFENLRENLREHGLDLNEIPLVLQYNKRDLPDVYSIEEMETALNSEGRWIYREATATNGAGVFETFKAIARILLAHLSKSMGLKAQGSSTAAAMVSGDAPEPSAPSAAPPAAAKPAMPPSPEPALPASPEPVRPMAAAPQPEMAPPPGLVNGPGMSTPMEPPAPIETAPTSESPMPHAAPTPPTPTVEPTSETPPVEPTLESPSTLPGLATGAAGLAAAGMAAAGMTPEEQETDDSTAEMESPIQRPSVSMDRPAGLESFPAPSTPSEPTAPAESPEPFRPMSVSPIELSAPVEPPTLEPSAFEPPAADVPPVQSPPPAEPTLAVVPGMTDGPSTARVIRIPVKIRAEDLRDGVILEIAVEAEENASNVQHG